MASRRRLRRAAAARLRQVADEERARCVSKIAYADKPAAAYARYHLERRGRVLVPYECSNCGKWHLGRRGARQIIRAARTTGTVDARGWAR